jgi:branched-chain amino acid transport system substrate-binding protein
MRAERRLVCAAIASVAALALLGSGCNSEQEPLRVGVLLECTGLLVASHDSVLAAASLPLLERGGRRSDDLVTGRAGGRQVELVPACTEFTYLHKLIFATRRLVEVERVDAVVGPIGGGESVVFRDLARRFPDVTFLAVEMGAQEATLDRPPPNLFRFAPTGAQMTAGLGSYAYRHLGWRRAAVVAEDWYPGWEQAAGFVAEFCALGGDVVERDWTTLLAPNPTRAALRHAREADGVLVLATIGTQVPYLAAYAAAARPARDRLLLAGSVFSDPRNLQPPGIDLTGVVVGGFVPHVSGSQAMRRYRSAFAQRFPELPSVVGEGIAEIAAYTAVEALLTAFEQTTGRVGAGQARLREAISGLVLHAPQGAVRLDRNRQASEAIYLERIEPRKSGMTPRTRLVRRIDGVNQSFDGIFGTNTPSPSKTDPTCERRRPPRWAS